MIHRQALATKNIINPLRDVLKQIIKLVNYVKRGAINSWFFKKTRKEMDSEHQHLLFYTTMCWLSQGNLVYRVFELRQELKSILSNQEKNEMVSSLENNHFIFRLACLAAVFQQLNKVNLKLQGRGRTIVDFNDTLSAFVEKLDNWKQKLKQVLWLKLTPTYLEKRRQTRMAKKVLLHHLGKNWRK